MSTASKTKTIGWDLPDNWESGKQIAVQCWQCGRKLKQNEHLVAIFKRVTCDPCIDSYNLQVEQEQDVQDEEVANVIPPLYRSTELAKLPFPEQVEDITFWRYSEGAKGLWITGDSRVGKTRSLCLLLERLIREKVTIRAFFHGSFADELLEVIRSDRNFRRWKREVAAEPLVVIDDLFAEKLTERTESGLFELLDERIAHLRPTLITTQVTKKEAKQRFHSEKRCDAFFSRIAEFFSLVRLGDPQAKIFAGD